MTEPSVPVTRELGQRVIEKVLEALPTAWLVMPIGGTAAGPLISQPGEATKDVDLVLFLVAHGKTEVPTTNQIADAIKGLLSNLEARKDQTSVAGFLRLEDGTVKVELIRGRSPGSGGYFVPRNVLLECAAIGRRSGRIIHLPAEALAFLKAWAAGDQDKLMENRKDPRGFHAARAKAFRRDVQNLLRAVLDAERRTPDGTILQRLLLKTGGVRRKATAAVLRENGWAGALEES